MFATPLFACAQNAEFTSFIDRIADQYRVDVAIAPELIPTLDSLKNAEASITSIQELLHKLLNQTGITYQLVDGNKLMLRQESGYEATETNAVIVGTIKDGETGMPLPYAAIYASHSNAACNSDDQGQFILSLKDTTGHITISYLGFENMRIPVREAMRHSIDAHLKVSEIPLKEVIVVVPYNLIELNYADQSTDLSGYQFISEDQLLKWNAERLITNMTFYTHFSSDRGIRIRGTEAENSLILMDDIPVYDPYHFYNIFSPFNGLYFSEVDVYKNNLPIQYGGRVDGLIHVQSDRESPHSKLIFDTDLLQTGISTELALTPDLCITAAGRLSHTDILNEALSDSSVTNFSVPGKFKDENEYSTTQQPITDFYDINVGLEAKTGDNSQAGFHFFDSRDQLGMTTLSNFQTTLFNHDVLTVEQLYQSRDVWKNRGYSGAFHSAVSNKTNLHLSAFHSLFDKEVNYTSAQTEERFGDIEYRENDGSQVSGLISSGGKIFADWKSGEVSSITAGTEYQHHQVTFTATENNETYIDETLTDSETSLFGDFSSMMGKKLSWSAGSRFTHLKSSGNIYMLPNLSLRYMLNNGWSFRTSYSKNLQTVREITLEDRFGREIEFLVLTNPEKRYPAMLSDKYMAGGGWSSTHLGIDVELYYKKTEGLARIRALDPDPGHGHGGGGNDPKDYYRLFTGQGRTYGIDLTLLYKQKKFEASILYTLSKIEEQYPMLFQGEYFTPQEDRRHQLKLSGTYQFGKFRAQTLVTYKSEAPYLSLVRLNQRGGIGQVNFETVTRYLPAYFSLDLGLDYTFKLFKQPAMIGVSLINATNHENISNLQHLGKVSRDNNDELYITSQTELLGRTGNVHFRVLIQ
jgi:hypothetical protein